MTAALYEGVIVHRRTEPAHAFTRRSWMLCADLDRLDDLDGLWPLLAVRRPALARHRREDFGVERTGPLAAEIRALVRDRLGVSPTGMVLLLAQARTAGWLFNPIAVYFVEHDGAPCAVVLEVTNTPWHERHQYVLDVRGSSAAETITREVPKAFHVSPFLPVQGLEYAVSVRWPGERCSVSVVARDTSRVVFSAATTLRRRALSRRGVARLLLRHPLGTVQVSAGIYGEAFRLWRKRTPFHPHPAPVGGAR